MEPRRSSIRIRLLGPIELLIDGAEVPLGGPRQRSLLALLALRAGQVVAGDALVEEVWAGEPTDAADTTLRSYVSRLRRAFHGAATIERTDRGYVLDAPSEAVDAIEFERLARDGGALLARGNARAARTRLGEALGMWRGRAFGDVGGNGALGDAAERLDERRLLAVEQRIEADLALGESASLVDELEGLVRDHPFRERLWQHLMVALYRAGRQADALAAYHRVRRALDEQLGIEPGEELRALEVAVLRQDVPAVTPRAAHDNLPSTLTSFIGRTREIADTARLLAEHRLVTLSGVGGVGKTRLAIEVARSVADRFADGVWFVDLAPLADPALLASHVGSVVGVRELPRGGMVDALLEDLRGRELLLVLDNAEHLRDACAELAAAVTRAAPAVRILATSRVTLGAPGEIDHAVAPLPVQGTETDSDGDAVADAVELFLQRARSARPSLLDDTATRATVTRIVADLDGLPLAIELAAARAKALTLADIAARLDDRFRLLVSWRRLASARHRTLAEAMAWSFDLLRDDERALLAELSVFAGSFDLDGVAAVCTGGDEDRALDVIQRLVDASLVILEAGALDASRYRLLETVRQYAAEELARSGRRDDVLRAHAEHFGRVVAAAPTLGSEHARGLARLDAERDNLRAAIDHAIAVGDPALQRRITTPLWRYWQIRGLLAEGAARLAATLEHGPDVEPELWANTVVGAGNLAWAMGRYEDGKRHGHELLRIAAESGAQRPAYVGNRLLAAIALRERDYEASFAHGERAVELIREIGTPIEIAMAEMNHAVLLMDWGRIDTAVARYEDLLERLRGLGHEEGIGLTLLNLGEAAFLQGDDSAARTRFEGARTAFETIGFRAHVGHSMQGLAAVAVRAGDAAEAAALLGAAGAILAEVGASPDDFNPAMVATATDSARHALGDDAFQATFDAAWANERRSRSA